MPATLVVAFSELWPWTQEQSGMGIYDRDYYRDTPSSWWPTLSGHQGVWLIIIVTCVTYLLQVAGLSAAGPARDAVFPEAIGRWGSFISVDVLNGQVWRLVTAQFVHSPYSLIQVALGMLALYFFGIVLEGIYGSAEFLAFYLTVGLLITLALTVAALAGLPSRPVYFGCQAALTAVLVLFACHFPHDRVYLLFIPVPAWLLAALWVGFSALGFLGGMPGAAPHLIAAGAAFGYHRINFRILGFLPNLSWPSTNRRRTPLQVFNPSIASHSRYESEDPTTPRVEVVPRSTSEQRPTSPPVDEQLEAKLDQLLEKVAREGRSSLTAEEHAILQRASDEYKKRRNQKA